MADSTPTRVTIKFPGDLEYIPAVRKFVSEMLQVNQFSPKFTFRSEIIIDEICNNAVTYGCLTVDSTVQVICLLYSDRIEFQVKDSGGRQEDIHKLRAAVKVEEGVAKKIIDGKRSAAGLGLEIVRMLSEEINFDVDDNNLTSIRVVRRRENSSESRHKAAK